MNATDIVAWLESLSGAITMIDVDFGGIAELVEGSGWDHSKTDYLLRLLAGLKSSVNGLETELRDHVNGKLA